MLLYDFQQYIKPFVTEYEDKEAIIAELDKAVAQVKKELEFNPLYLNTFTDSLAQVLYVVAQAANKYDLNLEPSAEQKVSHARLTKKGGRLYEFVQDRIEEAQKGA
jgi:NTP pyrophosphatase (non-canonical NTP hydrolase)